MLETFWTSQCNNISNSRKHHTTYFYSCFSLRAGTESRGHSVYRCANLCVRLLDTIPQDPHLLLPNWWRSGLWLRDGKALRVASSVGLPSAAANWDLCLLTTRQLKTFKFWANYESISVDGRSITDRSIAGSRMNPTCHKKQKTQFLVKKTNLKSVHLGLKLEIQFCGLFLISCNSSFMYVTFVVFELLLSVRSLLCLQCSIHSDASCMSKLVVVEDENGRSRIKQPGEVVCSGMSHSAQPEGEVVCSGMFHSAQPGGEVAGESGWRQHQQPGHGVSA